MVIQGLCFSKISNSIHGLDTICKTNIFFPTVNKHLCGVDIIILHVSYILCDKFLLSHFFILEHKATYVEIKVKFIEKV